MRKIKINVVKNTMYLSIQKDATLKEAVDILIGYGIKPSQIFDICIGENEKQLLFEIPKIKIELDRIADLDAYGLVLI